MRLDPTRRCALACLSLWIPLVARAAEPDKSLPGRADDALNRLFQPDTGWIGGDGGISVSIGPERMVWLFSDTWVGDVRDGKRTNATIVNNTAAVLSGKGDTAQVEFAIKRDADGKAQELIVPDDGKGFFWIHAGEFVNDRLLMFLVQIEKTDEQSAFGFREIGRWLGVVTNPFDPPAKWRVEQQKLPFTELDPVRSLGFGAAALRHGDFLYIYGIEERRERRAGPLGRWLTVARVPLGDADKLDAWKFYADGEWQADFRKVTPLTDDIASGVSVVPIPNRKQFALVYTHIGYSENIQVRTAPQPWGPWSAATTVYACPEMQWDKRIFCYGAVAHAGLSTDDEMVCCYFANSHDFWHVAADARLYWPKFVRVPWTAVP